MKGEAVRGVAYPTDRQGGIPVFLSWTILVGACGFCFSVESSLPGSAWT